MESQQAQATNLSSEPRRSGFLRIAPVDPIDVAHRLASIPISPWKYIDDADNIQHLGPMAQDFHAAFGLGASERHIATLDADGVALAAIQGVYLLVQ
jgi:trimeric autotransporter adhesin